MNLSAVLLALSLTAPIQLGLAPIAPVSAQEATITTLTPAQAKAATELLLKALSEKDASTIFKTLAGSIQTNVTVEKIRQRLDARAAITSGRINTISPGFSDTTVDAVVNTAEGEKPLMLILDEDGKLLAWKWVGETLPIETSALRFTEELAAGRWLKARSRLQIDFQRELAPGDLERKWTKLERVSGGFRKIKDAVIASQGGEQQLVLVSVEFGNATTNLFVIFDANGRIINVDISRDFV